MRILSRQHPEYVNVIIEEGGIVRPRWAVSHPLLQDYFDTEWGQPVRDEQGLFERLSLEGFQAGLSWLTILKKRPAFRQAFHDFDPGVVARYDDEDIERLMADAGIVRNSQKILAVINNAQATINLRDAGGLAKLIWSYQQQEDPVLDAEGNHPASRKNLWHWPRS